MMYGHCANLFIRTPQACLWEQSVEAAFIREDTEAIIRYLNQHYFYLMAQLWMKESTEYEITFTTTLTIIKMKNRNFDIKGRPGMIEIAINNGWEKRVYLMRMDLDKTAKHALDIVKCEDYDSYKRSGNIIHFLGINLSSRTRTIESWKEEILKL